MAITELYDSQDLDAQIEAAGEMLKQAAAEQGLDLGALSEDELAGMIAQLVDNNQKVAQEETPAPAAERAPQLSGAVVGVELAKLAAAENIDLASLTPEQYEECFNKVAEFLSNPEAQEEQRKLAAHEEAMDHLGRVAARGFADELAKLAAEEEKKDEDKDDEKAPPFAKKDKDEEDKTASAKDKVQAMLHGAKAMASKGMHGAKDMAGKGAHGADKGVQAVGRKVLDPKGKKEVSDKAARIAGGLTLGVGAGAAGGGAAAAMHRKKEAALEAAAQKLANQVLIENGIDPETGEKLASDEEVSARAVEILQERGYSL